MARRARDEVWISARLSQSINGTRKKRSALRFK